MLLMRYCDPPNPSNMCVNCLRNEVDITDGIPKNSTLHYCRNCDRYLQPPNHWVLCALESRELLALCLKKLKGLKGARLIDAGFIWTEPHLKRIKVKLTIQKESIASAILQQTFEVEFVVANQMCDDCTKIMAKNTWKASVQVRQKVPHKRTFLYLEQLILKHNVHKDTTNIKEVKDGLDFYYVQRGHAIKMFTLATAEVNTLIYQRHPFSSLCTSTSLTEFIVLDIETLGAHKGKVARAQDYGKNDTVFFTRTHLGGILHYGDLVYGYDLANSNLNDAEFDKLNADHVPNIVLIKKSYSNRRRKPRHRNWKIKSLVKEEEALTMRRVDQERAENDYEMFLRDIEEDPEFRASINLYKEERASRMEVDPILEEPQEIHMSDQEELDLDDLDDGFPEIKLEELLDDLKIDDDEDPNYAPDAISAGVGMDD
ncbi:ribosome-binding protein [Massospora cicadina]|nr:ribosome-binding protein [Massospora cicadina]